MKNLSPQDQAMVERIAEQYVVLKQAYSDIESMMKGLLADIRSALTCLDEDLFSVMEKVRDNQTDKATVRTPSGTFSTQNVTSFKVTDPELLRKQVLEGSVPPDIYGDEINRRAMRDYMEDKKLALGYFDLPVEQKDTVDLRQYLPGGVEPKPFERIIFRKPRNV